MPLIYSAVARGTGASCVVLAEYSVFAGNFNSVAKDYLTKSTNEGRCSYTVDSHVFSFLVDSGYCFVVVTDEAAGRTIPNAFLDKVKEDFVTKYAEKGKQMKEGGLTSFSKRLKEMMEHATQFPEEYSKVVSVKRKVDEVKTIMGENIEKVLNRGEKLDLLVDKTDNLMFEADRFQKQGRALRRKMACNNIKMKLIMGLVVVMVIIILVLLICFSGGRNCAAKSAHKATPSPSPTPSPAVGPSLTGNADATTPEAPSSNRRLLRALVDGIANTA